MGSNTICHKWHDKCITLLVNGDGVIYVSSYRYYKGNGSNFVVYIMDSNAFCHKWYDEFITLLVNGDGADSYVYDRIKRSIIVRYLWDFWAFNN